MTSMDMKFIYAGTCLLTSVLDLKDLNLIQDAVITFLSAFLPQFTPDTSTPHCSSSAVLLRPLQCVKDAFRSKVHGGES